MSLPSLHVPIARHVNGSLEGYQHDGKADLTPEMHPLGRGYDVTHTRVNACLNFAVLDFFYRRDRILVIKSFLLSQQGYYKFVTNV